MGWYQRRVHGGMAQWRPHCVVRLSDAWRLHCATRPGHCKHCLESARITIVMYGTISLLFFLMSRMLAVGQSPSGRRPGLLASSADSAHARVLTTLAAHPSRSVSEARTLVNGGYC